MPRASKAAKPVELCGMKQIKGNEGAQNFFKATDWREPCDVPGVLLHVNGLPGGGLLERRRILGMAGQHCDHAGHSSDLVFQPQMTRYPLASRRKASC
jgi:hypothetical protein